MTPVVTFPCGAVMVGINKYPSPGFVIIILLINHYHLKYILLSHLFHHLVHQLLLIQEQMNMKLVWV